MESEKDIKSVIERLEFVFAKSMPKIPHYYTVKDESNKEDYEELFLYILKHGVYKKFWKQTYKYLTIGNYEYWVMSEDITVSKIINRREV